MKEQIEKQAIEEMARILCKQVKSCAECSVHKPCLMMNCAEILTEKGYRKQSEWISVEERLPEKSGYYLICQKSSLWCEEIIQTARWNISSQRFRGAQAGCFMDNVTHWMPLPEAPKMKGGAE